MPKLAGLMVLDVNLGDPLANASHHHAQAAGPLISEPLGQILHEHAR